MANADKTKNIYGNSRHSSPIEMTSLLTTNGLAGSNQHSNPRGSSILKITQYRLQDVRFVEELGKAYKKILIGMLLTIFVTGL